MSAIPHLFVVLDDDTNQHLIMVHSFGMTAPFGPRIFRAPPHPSVKHAHDTAEGAAKDVALINAYFTDLPSRRKSVRKDPVYGNGLGGIEDCPLFFI